MDPYEAQLEEDIRRRRAELLTKAETVKRSFVETFDPRERVRRNPLGSLLATVGAGMFLGRMVSGRSARANGRVAEVEPPEPEESSLASLAMSVLPTLLPTLLPAVVRPLISLVLPKRTKPRPRKPTNSH